MNYKEHIAYRLSTTDVQRAIILVMLMAQHLNGSVNEAVFVSTCCRFGIGKSAQTTALRFYQMFRADGFMTFPTVITNEDVLLAYLHYKGGQQRVAFFDLIWQSGHGGSSVSLSRVAEERKQRITELEAKAEEYWGMYEDALEEKEKYRLTSVDLSNRLTRARVEADKFQKSFTEIVLGMLSDKKDETPAAAGA